jgi:valyl-tRNA synthetase
VVNPLEVMDAQGTDALRFTLATSGTPGQDLNLNPQRIEAARNFANKIWNITRFVLTKLNNERQPAAFSLQPSALSLSLADRWILSRYHRLCQDVDRLMEGYNFGEAGRQIHDFLWSEFADWYVEAAKVQLEGDAAQQQATRATLFTVLEGSLRLLHPFMPFVTEEVWQYLRPQPAARSPHSIMLAEYPQGDAQWLNPEAERDWALVQELIVAVRNIRSEYKVEPAHWVAATIAAGAQADLLRAQAPLISRLGRVAADQLQIVAALAEKPRQAAAIVIGAVEAYLPLAGMIDLEAERARLQKELAQLEADVARREARLANESFVSKAPEAVVQRERAGLEATRAALAKLHERLGDL